MRLALPTSLLLAACSAAAIGKSPEADESATCEPKTTAACTCGEQTGRKACGASGTYGACACDGVLPAVDADASTTTTTADAAVAAPLSCTQLARCCGQLRTAGQTFTADDCDTKVAAADANKCADLVTIFTGTALGTPPFCTL